VSSASSPVLVVIGILLFKFPARRSAPGVLVHDLS
jgi:hypothetical protein